MNSADNKKNLVALLTNNDDDIYCFRKELIEGLLDAGYEMLVSCPYGEKLELMKHVNYRYDNPSIDRRGTNAAADLKLCAHYYRLFKKHKPSVVLTYTAKPNVYASLAARLLSIPYINNVTGFGSVLNMNGAMRSFVMQLFKLAYAKASCIMFQNSTNMKLAVESGMVKGRSILIPGSGVATDRFPLQSYPEGGNGIYGEPVVFNYIGRILHDKGVDDYIQTARCIKAKFPRTEFNMMGFIEPTEIHYEQELKQLEADGIINYLGSQQDVRPFIARSHATIHPSTYGEGMSNVLLESASSGRPLITTDNPGCKETLVDGKTGFVYKGGIVKECCDAIEKFLGLGNAERKNMGIAGRQHVETHFSRTIVVQSYLDEINKILRSC